MSIMTRDDYAKFPYFSPDEFACECCGVVRMQREFMVKLSQARGRAKFPFVITSGYRCPKHNQAVSGTGPDGPHTTGMACDVAVSFNRAFELLNVATSVGFQGIGLKQHSRVAGRFMHLDMLAGPGRPRVWTYD